MIGTKKLSTIRKEIEEAFASRGEDAIQRLDRTIASAKRRGESTEVTEGLKRFLEMPRKRKPRKQRARQSLSKWRPFAPATCRFLGEQPGHDMTRCGLDERFDTLGNLLDQVGRELAKRVAAEVGRDIRVIYGPRGGWCRRYGRGHSLIVEH
jgi:hypothetical protein